MKWSFRIGTVAGTEVRVHVTFLVLLAAFGWIYFAKGGAGMALDGVLFIVAVFACVLLHEFGHVLMARRFGIRTPDITLLPIGGLAPLERMPEKPREELLVAVAGPAVNVVIAAVLWPFVGLAEVSGDPEAFFEIPFLQRLMMTNIVLVAFNLIPAFPMDGGRVLRALLAMVMPYGKATGVAATVGQALAVLGAIVAIKSGAFMILIIAVFIFMAARGESEMVQTGLALSGVPLERAMMRDFQVLRPHDTMGDAAAALLAGSQHDFPVVDEEGGLVGLLTRSGLIEALAKSGPGSKVGLAMLHEVPTVPLHFPLREAYQVLHSSPLESLPVVADGGKRVLGLLNAENIGELILIRNALGATETP